MIQTVGNKKSECCHINNMVGLSLTSKIKKSLYANNDKVSESLKGKNKETRLLLDLLTVTITPKLSKNGWKIIKNIDNKTIKDHGLYDFKPRGKITELSHDEFFEFFIEYFDDLFDFSKTYDEFGGGGGGDKGGGYNYGRMYKLGKTDAFLGFKSFNPDNSDKDDSEYVSGSKHNQFIRQKVRLSLTGNGVQYLRSKGRLLEFIIRLYETFPTTATAFDIAMDFFNYDLTPKYFLDLYLADFYTGRAKVGMVANDAKSPTVYIGSFKSNESVMLYDKILEAKDTGNSDEPELLEVLEDTGGSWFRLEQHYSNDKRKAEQAFAFIVYNLFQDYNIGKDLDDRFIELLSSLLHDRLTAPRKPRFLSEKRMERNNMRIPTDNRWQLIIDEINNVEIDFTYKMPELTLEERMDNFKYRGLGGKKLFQDVIDELGEESLREFMKEVVDYQIEINRREKEKQVLE